jgi:hypothetical protein
MQASGALLMTGKLVDYLEAKHKEARDDQREDFLGDFEEGVICGKRELLFDLLTLIKKGAFIE